MIHYAALPRELIFEGLEEYNPKYLSISFARGALIVEPLLQGEMRIVRLMSSDLQDYLDPRFQPGRLLDPFAGELQMKT